MLLHLTPRADAERAQFASETEAGLVYEMILGLRQSRHGLFPTQTMSILTILDWLWHPMK